MIRDRADPATDRDRFGYSRPSRSLDHLWRIARRDDPIISPSRYRVPRTPRESDDFVPFTSGIDESARSRGGKRSEGSRATKRGAARGALRAARHSTGRGEHVGQHLTHAWFGEPARSPWRRTTRALTIASDTLGEPVADPFEAQLRDVERGRREGQSLIAPRRCGSQPSDRSPREQGEGTSVRAPRPGTVGDLPRCRGRQSCRSHACRLPPSDRAPPLAERRRRAGREKRPDAPRAPLAS